MNDLLSIFAAHTIFTRCDCHTIIASTTTTIAAVVPEPKEGEKETFAIQISSGTPPLGDECCERRVNKQKLNDCEKYLRRLQRVDDISPLAVVQLDVNETRSGKTIRINILVVGGG